MWLDRDVDSVVVSGFSTAVLSTVASAEAEALAKAVSRTVIPRPVRRILVE
jgi:microcompartment protein CcmL/EutN